MNIYMCFKIYCRFFLQDMALHQLETDNEYSFFAQINLLLMCKTYHRHITNHICMLFGVDKLHVQYKSLT
jgi:hypothetical protein